MPGVPVPDGAVASPPAAGGLDTSAARFPRDEPPRRAAPLSRADEVRLAKRIREGDRRARERMIEGNVGLVHAIARRYMRPGVPLADLVQEGTVGLIRAVDRFDYTRGLKFSTYAVWWIRRSVLDAISDAQAIRIPAKSAQHIAAVRNAEAELEQSRCATATPEALAGHTGLPLATIDALRSAARVTASLDSPLGEDSAVLGDTIADEHGIDPLESIVVEEREAEVAKLMRLLPDRHRRVVSSRYGLNGALAQSHQQIGQALGVGEERCRQLEREALYRLRSVVSRTAVAA